MTPTQLRWIASFSASTFHAAVAVRNGEALIDATIADALAEPIKLLAKEIAACGLPEDRALEMLTALSMEIENNTELATATLTKIRGRNETTDMLARQLAGRIADLEAAMRHAKPGIVDELAMRGQPLKDQWDARGSGMLLRLAQSTDSMLVPERLDVALVYPVLGGSGAAHLPFNSVRIEAVLANPSDQLPEIVRLGWLISQLQCDLPIFGERVARDRLPRVAALAMLPPTLAAAEAVELVWCGAETTRLALEAWRLVDVAEANSAQLAEVLNTWWQTYLDNPPHWSVALMALDRMLAATCVPL